MAAETPPALRPTDEVDRACPACGECVGGATCKCTDKRCPCFSRHVPCLAALSRPAPETTREQALYSVLAEARDLLGRRNLDGSLSTGRKQVDPLREAVAAFDAVDAASPAEPATRQEMLTHAATAGSGASPTTDSAARCDGDVREKPAAELWCLLVQIRHAWDTDREWNGHLGTAEDKGGDALCLRLLEEMRGGGCSKGDALYEDKIDALRGLHGQAHRIARQVFGVDFHEPLPRWRDPLPSQRAGQPADATAPTPAEALAKPDASESARLREEIERLTKERDEARAQLEKLGWVLNLARSKPLVLR